MFSSDKIIVIAAPSGSGKTTIIKHLLEQDVQLQFSISACTRAPRGIEKDGVDYHFLTTEEFKSKIEENAFVEWEMVYKGQYYGTLHAELSRIWQKKCYPLIDIDVKGAINIKNKFKDKALLIFIQAPSMEELKNRLEKRGTDSPKAIEERLKKASYEMEFANRFDKIIINKNLENAVATAIDSINKFTHS